MIRQAILTIALAVLVAPPALAQAPDAQATETESRFEARGEQIVALINGELCPASAIQVYSLKLYA